ncbi:MAG: hypothetical protein KME64_36980 [Scytonematopsis contorta HA4267-MV1]|nr:hypothetical protein [Scytonematopsis contorta HA4267-MV1]
MVNKTITKNSRDAINRVSTLPITVNSQQSTVNNQQPTKNDAKHHY